MPTKKKAAKVATKKKTGSAPKKRKGSPATGGQVEPGTIGAHKSDPGAISCAPNETE